MNSPTRNQSATSLRIPVRQNALADKGMVALNRQVTSSNQTIAAASRSIVSERYLPSVTAQRPLRINQQTFPLTLPMPPELPPAMTFLLPSDLSV
jgi:hypothetical protein